MDGWLYGEVNGAAITFLYPGMRRGLRGAWEDGRIVAATAVKVGLRVTSPAGVGSKVQRRHVRTAVSGGWCLGWSYCTLGSWCPALLVSWCADVLMS